MVYLKSITIRVFLGEGYRKTTIHSLFDDKNITWIPVICHNLEEIEQAIKEDCELVCQAEGLHTSKNQRNIKLMVKGICP